MTILRWLLTRRTVQRCLRPILFRLTERVDYAVPTWDEPCFYTRNLFSLFGWTLDLHKFVQEDPLNDYHSHPYRAWRLVLSGGYVEQVMPPNSPVIEYEDGVYGFVYEPFVRFLHEGQGGRVEVETVHRIAALVPHAGNPRREDYVIGECYQPAFSLWLHGPRTADIRGYRYEGDETPC